MNPPAAQASAAQAPAHWRTADGLRYGLLGLPLAVVALPLYVILPNHYAREFGMPLALLGAILLGARLFDALIDPLLGRLSDRLFARAAASVLRLGALAAVALALGFTLLFFPLQVVQDSPFALATWASASLVLTYTAYSALSVSHQSWGAMLGGNEAQRSRIGNQTGGRVAFFLNTDDFHRDHAAMLSAGVEFLEAPREEAYATVAVFRDLYGNTWDLLEPRQ